LISPKQHFVSQAFLPVLPFQSAGTLLLHPVSKSIKEEPVIFTRQFVFAVISITGASSRSGAQEFDFESPQAIASVIQRSDVAVIGTFRTLLSLPWLDGWHRFASIQVEAVIYGPATIGDELHHRSVDGFGHTWCLRCEDFRYDSVRAIWFLKKSASQWELSGHGWCFGPLPLDKRPTIERIAQSLR